MIVRVSIVLRRTVCGDIADTDDLQIGLRVRDRERSCFEQFDSCTRTQSRAPGMIGRSLLTDISTT